MRNTLFSVVITNIRNHSISDISSIERRIFSNIKKQFKTRKEISQMKINGLKLDNPDYFGKTTEFLVMEANKKLDFKTKQEVGTVLTVLSFDNYETYRVNLLGKKITELKDLKKGSVVEFDDLEARVYLINGKVVVSCKAKDLFVSFEKKSDDLFMAINEEYEN